MKKILIIEDAQSLRRDIQEMLTFEGFDVCGAENGIVGVQKAREVLPDLIICDIMMPGMDGYGVLEDLRKTPATSTIPFIFLTARTDRVDMRQGMELGADDYLTKPFTASELLATVNTRLEKKAVITEVSERKLTTMQQNLVLSLPHELRTPLNVVLGFSDLLMTDYEVMDTPRIGEMARHINNAALRLYRLIENFLIYANIQILTTSPEQVEALRAYHTENPKTIIEYLCINKFQQAGRELDLQLQVEDAKGINISEDYLKKMLEEMIDNALKFSEPGQSISVQGQSDGSRYSLRVIDHGRGMTPEQIANIGAYMQFERHFYEQQGSGLGLAIIKRIAELFNGSLTITSVPNQQTTVQITLHIH